MRKLLYILFLLPVLCFSQVKLTTGTNGYFNIQITDGQVIGYPKDNYEIVVDERGFVWLRNINTSRNIVSDKYGVYFGNWRINGQTPVSASALIDSLKAYVYNNSETASNIISAQTDDGNTVDLAATGEGHLEVAIHAPRLPFGSVHVENLTPVFQSDAVYGINQDAILTTTGRAIAGAGSGTATAANNMFTVTTGTTSYSFGTIQSRKRLRYRPGQGVVGRFAGLFSEPAAGSILVAGFGTGEAGYYYGYRNDTFGILHSTGGAREIQTLTVSVASSNTDTITITLNSVGFEVPVTNSGSTLKTAYEISKYSYTGWRAEQVGSTVVFTSNDVGNKAGTFSLSSAISATGTFAETKAGGASTDTWYFQSDWNGDKLDGTGPSAYTIDPQKGNVYQIGVQYLGFGTVTFQIEVVNETNNNADFVTVHTIKFPNTLSVPHSSNPSYPFTMAAYSAGSTTNVSVSVGSFAGFIEGEKKLNGPRMSYTRETSNYVGSSAGTYYPMFSIRNSNVYATRANQSVVNLLSISGAHDDATPITLYILRNATLAGTPNFTQFSTKSSTYWDVAATTCTITSNDQIIYSLMLGQNSGGSFAFSDEVTIQPGETITIAARAVTGTATYVNASLNTREDQ